jgi:hypothetical protein
MKLLLLSLLFFCLVSCSKPGKESSTHNSPSLKVDSILINSSMTKGFKKVKMPSDFVEIEDYKFFNLESMEFYELSNYKFSESILLKVILSKPKYVAVYDGELRIVYLMTTEKNERPIDCIRVGKVQGAADYDFHETSTIQHESIIRNSDESFLQEDSVGIRRLHHLKKEIFEITRAGKIKRKSISVRTNSDSLPS